MAGQLTRRLNFGSNGEKDLFAPWLRPVDLLVLVFSLILLVFGLVVSRRLPEPGWMVAENVLLVALLFVLRPGTVPAGSLLSWVRDLYVAPVVYLFYRQACLIAQAVHGERIYDSLLVRADRWLFGADPTVWLASYTRPFVTEILQLAYASFYLLFLLVAWDLLRSRKRKQFDLFSFGVIYGFGLSYLGYWLLPSVGPRFVLHRFSALDSELPGLVLTPYLRAFVNSGGSITQGVTDQVAMSQAYPDVFPSGHVMMTIALIFWSWKFSSAVRWPVSVIGSLLIVSTVYLRYHYVVDVFAGAGLAGFCLASHRSLYQLTEQWLAGASPIARQNLERSR